MKKEEEAKSFFSHLEDLRKTLIKCIAALFSAYIPAYLVTPFCMQKLIVYCCPPQMRQLNYFGPMEVFILQLKAAFIIAAIIALPYCLWQIWNFLLPALYDSERRALKGWIGLSVLLFAAGSVLCAGLVLPLLMEFSASFETAALKPVIGLSQFFNLAFMLIIAFGLMFQFPLAVLLAVRFGLVKTAFLKEKRPYVIVLILILAAVLTPPDVVSQLLLGVPTWLLFEAALLMAKTLEPKEEDTGKTKGGKANKETLEKAEAVTAYIDSKLQTENMEDNTMLDFYIAEEHRKAKSKKK